MLISYQTNFLIVMKKLLLIAVLAGLSFSTQARKVMFQVNMTGQTISANGVHLVGNFKDINYDNVDENPLLVNWSPTAYAMTDPNADGIYTYIMDMAGDLPYEFKFVNDNDWPGAENVPALSQVGGGNGNRYTWVNSGTDTLMLPAVMFGGTAPAGMKLVKFQVDMAKVSAVSANGVHVAGAFQGWNPAGSRMLNYAGNGAFAGSLYTYLGYLAASTPTEFKYVNDNGWGGAESVPSACNTNGNRSFAGTANDTTLAKVCFASCDACPANPIPVYNVTFRVDMAAACAYDSVDVAGGKINNWAGGTRLMPLTVGSTIHTVTVALDSGEVEYKFRKIIAGGANWEGVANRLISIHSDTTLALVCFDKTTACGTIVAPANVRFIVDLSNEVPNANGDIFIMGNFTQPNWQSGAIKLTPVVGQIGMYETTVNMCQADFAFQFSNGPVSNNANVESFSDTTQRACVVNNGVGGWNRTYTRTDGNAKTIAYVFNTCTVVSLGLENNKLEATSISMYPNPSNEFTSISFNDNATKHNVTVTDVTGRIVAKYSTIENKLNVNTQNLNAGVYIVSIQNERNESASLKLMVR